MYLLKLLNISYILFQMYAILEKLFEITEFSQL